MNWELIGVAAYSLLVLVLCVRVTLVLRRLKRTGRNPSLTLTIYGLIAILIGTAVGVVGSYSTLDNTPARWAMIGIHGVLVAFAFWTLRRAKRDGPAA